MAGAVTARHVHPVTGSGPYRVLVVGDEADLGRIAAAVAAAEGQFDLESTGEMVEPTAPAALGHDVIIIGDALRNPLNAAADHRTANPSAEILFFLHPDRIVRFRSSLGFVPHLASAWTVSAAAKPETVRATLRDAAEVARNRASSRGLFDQINQRLSAPQSRSREVDARRSQLAISERYLATVLSQSPDGFLAVDPAGALIAWNGAAARLFGLAYEDAHGRPVVDLFPEEYRLEIAEHIRQADTAPGRLRREVQLPVIGGEQITAEISFAPVRDDAGKMASVSMTARDVTARRRAEDELRDLNRTLQERIAQAIAEREHAEQALRQAQKMEAVGQLTGGIAHDFNNLLQVISGNLDILSRNLPEDSVRLRRATDNALAGAKRAATLTQRLLAFSRRQPLAPKPIDVNRLVRDTSELLHRSLGERTELETVLATRLWTVEADPNQLENTLVNLAVNARDAMPGGGKLTIETSNTILDQAYTAAHSEVIAGQYVLICVSDTGTGMDEETVGRVFEPFFTTKETGQGTGLGLSQVYGFVKQSGGHIKVYTELGHGTTVKIYLPRFVGSVASEEPAADMRAPEGHGSEIILVVEDDEGVRAYSVEVLRELGYDVRQAADAASALEVLRREPAIDLLFTDVVLPGEMTGADLAKVAREIRPRLKVLFTTGYARNAIVHHGRLDAGVNLITKPFGYPDLASKVRDILDAP